MNSLQVGLADHLGAALLGSFLLTTSLAMIAVRSLWRRARAPQAARGPWRRTLGSLVLAVVGTAGALLAGSGLIAVGPSLHAQARLIDKVAPPLEYRRVVDDAAGRLADHRGKAVLVNVWATWCPPCRAEMPDLDRLQRDLGDRGLVVLTVSDEKRPTLEAFLAQTPMATEHVYVEAPPWHAFGRPTSFVVDRAGTIRHVIQGPRSHKQFSEMVEPYL